MYQKVVTDISVEKFYELLRDTAGDLNLPFVVSNKISKDLMKAILEVPFSIQVLVVTISRGIEDGTISIEEMDDEEIDDIDEGEGDIQDKLAQMLKNYA